MINRFLLFCFLLIYMRAPSYAQNSRLTDSLKLDFMDSMMREQNSLQKFDSAIFYAKEVDSLTFVLYGFSRDYAISTNNVGYFYGQNFDYVNEEKYCKKAIPLYEKYTGKNGPDYASAINNLAALYDDLGDYTSAEPLYKESASIRKTIPEDDSDYAESLNNLGQFYLKTENYESAKATLEQSLSIRERLFGKAELYAQTLNILAKAIQKTGNYALAETKYKEGISVIINCCGKEINEYWDIDNNLASLYYEMGNYKAAENVHREVLSHILRKFHKKIPDYGTTLGLLARDYNTSGDFDSALIYLKEESEILLKDFTIDHPDYATNLNLIASTYEKKGELDSAKQYYQKVLVIRKKNFGTNVPIYAETLNSIGLIYLEERDFANAEINLREAAIIWLAKLGNEHPDYAETINNLTSLYYASNNYKKWSEGIDNSLNTWKNSTTHLLLSFGEREKQTYLENHLSQRDLFLSMLWYFSKNQNTDLILAPYFKIVTAFQGWLLSGSQELNSIINQKKDSSLFALYKKWSTVRNLYTRVIQLSNAQQRSQNLNADSLMLLAGDLEKSIISKLPELQKSLNDKAVSPVQIAAKLKANEVLVNWVSFKYKNPKKWTDSVLYAAFIISAKDTKARFVYAFEQSRLKTLLEYYHSNSGRGINIKQSHARKNIDFDLYKLIWRPLLPYIKNANKVFLIPSGLLNKVSFQSLKDTSNKTLLETVEVHLLNNTDELDPTYSKLENDKTITLFGGANFDRSQSGEVIDSNTNKPWRFLEGSADEVKQLSLMFKKNNWSTKLYSGIYASEENFKSLSGKKSPEILHIATHGFYEPPAAQPEGLNKSADENESNSPLLRSGFILSGSNIYWGKDIELNNQEDGIVRAQEISDLDFSNTKLLTLSACESALGDIDNNEGVYGLQRAFKIAGVKDMLITLWSIPDLETKELMTLFYKNVLRGSSYYDALRRSQLVMKKKYPDPSVWAGFELIGE